MEVCQMMHSLSPMGFGWHCMRRITWRWYSQPREAVSWRGRRELPSSLCLVPHPVGRLKSKNDWYDGWDRERRRAMYHQRREWLQIPHSIFPPRCSRLRVLTPRLGTLLQSQSKREPQPSPDLPRQLGRIPQQHLPLSPKAHFLDQITVTILSWPSHHRARNCLSLASTYCLRTVKCTWKKKTSVTKVVLSTNIFSCPKSMQALARRMATLSLEQQDLISDTRLTTCHEKAKREQIEKTLGIDPKLIISIMMTPPLFEPPTKRSRIAELSEMSTSLRAINLMRRGWFPTFPASKTGMGRRCQSGAPGWGCQGDVASRGGGKTSVEI